MVFIGSGRPKTLSRRSPDGLKRMQNIFKETQPDETQRPCIKPQRPSRPKILLKINAKIDRQINASLYEIVSKGLMSFLDNPRSARRIDRCIDSLSYEIHVYNVLHMHQRLYLFHPIAQEATYASPILSVPSERIHSTLLISCLSFSA